MREIVLDTETTGLDPKSGHRLVEIGCLELKNLVPTGEVFHVYVNPLRDMPQEAFNVHGLSEEFLKDHPVFADIAEGFLEFIADDPLVIHNAQFDLKFLNYELKLLKKQHIPFKRAIDTLSMARKRYPGSPASLDALCRRFQIDNSSRTKHGALLDSELLADVYLELKGGRQPGFGLGKDKKAETVTTQASVVQTLRDPRPHAPTQQESERHSEFLKKVAKPVWGR